MKVITGSLLALACLAGPCRAAAAEHFRTDINPALLYWQAFAVIPDLSPDDQKYLFETEWRHRPLDARAGDLALQFNSTFRLLTQAAASQAPCDWGVDLSEGPRVLLPHLAKAKRCAQAAVLRARWFVQENRPDQARNDLLAAFILGRNLSRDQVLISCLVQFAIEHIVAGHIVQQWPVLDTATIGELLTGFDKAPPRGTIAACMPTERTAFHDWLVREMTTLQAKHPNDEARALAAATALLAEVASEPGQNRTDFAAAVVDAAGHSMAGLIRYIRQLEPFYAELEEAMRLPYAEFQPVIEDLQQRVTAHPNLLLKEFFPALLSVRLKEFRVIARLAMLRAAYQHRLDPAHGLAHVQDPFGEGSFQLSRFVLDGVDRGFKLASKLQMPEFDEVQIFAERAGPAFFIDGPRAGQKVP